MSGYMSGLMGIDPGRALYLDIGNSRITVAEPATESKTIERSGRPLPTAATAAVPTHWNKLESIPVSLPTNQTVTALVHLLQNQAPDRPIVAASVRRDIENDVTASLPNRFHWIGRTSFQTFIASYETPNTLGLDRILTAWGGWLQLQHSAIIIDSGTACTIDAVIATQPGNAKTAVSNTKPTSNPAIFAGGVIMPGIHTLHKSLRHAAPELPGVPLSLPQIFPGKSTQSCLEWGINGLFADGVMAHIRRFRARLGDVPVLLTGGDAALLHTWLSGFGVMGLIVDPFLIFKGMSQLPEHL